MEQMPHHLHVAQGPHKVFPPTVTSPSADAVTTSEWQAALPVLCGAQATLRELRLSDAPALLAMLSTEEVSRFISPPPTTVEGFEQFIRWAHTRQSEGLYACFAVVPHGMDTAIGMFQVRALEPGFRAAEWGFALGSAYWGRGYFTDGASQVLAFAFETLGVGRLEARSSVQNLRGNGALRKVGAVLEGTLRQSFCKDGQYHDQNLWTMLAADWASRRPSGRGAVVPHLAPTATTH